MDILRRQEKYPYWIVSKFFIFVNPILIHNKTVIPYQTYRLHYWEALQRRLSLPLPLCRSYLPL